MEPLRQIPQVPKKQQQKHSKEAIAPLPSLCEWLGFVHNRLTTQDEPTLPAPQMPGCEPTGLAGRGWLHRIVRRRNHGRKKNGAVNEMISKDTQIPIAVLPI